MKLELKWKRDEFIFDLGILEKIGDEYVFKIDEEGLGQAIKKGCLGIGNFDLRQREYHSKELFSFFKNRIIDENEMNVKELLERYEIEKYDEMQLLKATKARLATDNYFMEEDKSE